MLISASRLRNEFVLRSFWRRCVSLCWTSGWSITMTLEAMSSEDRTIAANSQGRAPAGAPLGRELATGSPGSPLEHLREGQLVGGETEDAAHALGGAVEERHGQRAPFDDHVRRDLVLVAEHGRVLRDDGAPVDEEAAVAVLGQAREVARRRDGHAGPLERLEERVGEPLR